MGAERRQSVRIKRTLMMHYRLAGQEAWKRNRVIDIGERGMCFVSSGHILENKRIAVRLKLPIKPPDVLEIQGHVIGSKAKRSAITLTRIEFQRLSARKLEVLREYIAWVLIKERGAK